MGSSSSSSSPPFSPRPQFVSPLLLLPEAAGKLWDLQINGRFGGRKIAPTKLCKLAPPPPLPPLLSGFGLGTSLRNFRRLYTTTVLLSLLPVFLSKPPFPFPSESCNCSLPFSRFDKGAPVKSPATAQFSAAMRQNDDPPPLRPSPPKGSRGSRVFGFAAEGGRDSG